MSNNQTKNQSMTIIETKDSDIAIKFNRNALNDISDQLTITDRADGLELFHYVDCQDNSSDLLKQCRGVVFSGDKIVLKTYPYQSEIKASDFEKNMPTDEEGTRYFDSYEGALIRAFNYDNKWYVGTHRKLDASKSKWGNSKKSFGDRFKDEIIKAKGEGKEEEKIYTSFLDSLNKDHQYVFMLPNTKDNYIACHSFKGSGIYHVGTFHEGVPIEENLGLPTPTEHNFKNNKEMLEYVRSVDPNSIQGIIAFTPTTQYKVLNDRYAYLFSLRGNVSSIKFRYLHIIQQTPKDLEEFINLYKNNADEFKMQDDFISQICTVTYDNYIGRYVKHKYIYVSKEENYLLKQVKNYAVTHKKYITKDRIYYVLMGLGPVVINKLIKHFRFNVHTDQ